MGSTNRHGDFVNYTGSLAPTGEWDWRVAEITYSLRAESDTHEHIRVIQTHAPTRRRSHSLQLGEMKKITISFLADFFFCWIETTTTTNGIDVGFVFFVFLLFPKCVISWLLCVTNSYGMTDKKGDGQNRRRPRLERHWLFGLLKGFRPLRGASGLGNVVNQSSARWRLQLKPPLDGDGDWVSTCSKLRELDRLS